jgi:succinate dehydrogenase / fumarate reductase, cytochrome b subunit
MSAAAIAGQSVRRFRFYDTTTGKKTVMAVTGLLMFSFIVGHLAGNLQIFEGREKLNHYAVMLRALPAALWGFRIAMLVSVCLHMLATFQLWQMKRKARPEAYVRKDAIASSYASRTMYWSGPIVAAFIVYHLLHFTFGVVHPNFQEQAGLGIPDAYDNVVNGFRQIPVALAYVVAICLLGTHLYHGLYSFFQTLGAAHPRYTPIYRRFAIIASVLITLGYISIPIAVMTGLVGSEINGTRL